jgi:glycosyltransferase involved in cell wall biosynthesis
MTGGSSRLVVDLIEHLGHLYEQEVLTSYNPNPPSYVGVQINEYPNVSSPRDVIKYFQRFRPDFLHVHYWGDCDESWYKQVFDAAERFGCQIIENINTPVEPYLSGSVVQYVYVSEFVYRTFGKGVDKSIVILPGSNLSMFRRKNTPDPPDDCIGMVYRLERDKLDPQSIDVFIKVAKQRHQTRVLIVGGGTLLKIFKDKVRSQRLSELFTFTGYVSYQELPALYEQISIFVAPVSRESFGQVSTFAMNMGIPVVGYDVGALAEIIDDKELLARPRHSDRLADIIVDLLDNRQKRLCIGNRNHERAQSMFSVEAMVRRYGELYEALLTGKCK